MTSDKNSKTTLPDAEARPELVAWMDALEFYARDWDETFDGRPSYFTQEFWYLLIGCLRADWAGRPLTVSQVAHGMKSGSNRTREERIKRAVDDGYLVKERGQDDGREAIVRPTKTLEDMMVGHLQRTMARIQSTMVQKSD